MSSTLRQAERRADNIIHVIGVSAGIVAVAAMLVAALTWLPAYSTLSLAIYGFALVAMVSCSAASGTSSRRSLSLTCSEYACPYGAHPGLIPWAFMCCRDSRVRSEIISRSN